MKRTGRWLALLAVSLIALAGCVEKETGGGAGAGKEARGDIRIEVVTHGTAADPFWSVVKNGVDKAAKDMGVEVNYRAPDTFDVVEIQRNLDSAIATQPDGIALTVVDPDALGDTVRKAVDQGIPVVVLNTGQADWEELGALAYVGQTEFEAGVGAGERMADEGVTNALCFNHEQGNVALDQRCDGFEEGLSGSVKQIAIDGTDRRAEWYRDGASPEPGRKRDADARSPGCRASVKGARIVRRGDHIRHLRPGAVHTEGS